MANGKWYKNPRSDPTLKHLATRAKFYSLKPYNTKI